VITGLVLAAGAGRRFGSQSKLLAELGGRPLLEHAVGAQCEVLEISRVVVVLGARASEVLERVEFGRAEPVVCRDWSSGQAASLRCGVAALPEATKVIVTLGDQPLITPSVIARFVEQPGGARAVWRGRPGHPVVLGSRQIGQIASLSGDRGARAVLGDGPKMECSGMGDLGRDVDTPEELEAIRHEVRAVI
jgi:molybdenum cofactor cytidylyltransferase